VVLPGVKGSGGDNPGGHTEGEMSDARLVADALRDCGQVQAALCIEKRIAEREKPRYTDTEIEKASRGREQRGQAGCQNGEHDAGSHPAPSPTLDELRAERDKRRVHQTCHDWRTERECWRALEAADSALIAALEAELEGRSDAHCAELARAEHRVLRQSLATEAAERDRDAFRGQAVVLERARLAAERERDQACAVLKGEGERLAAMMRERDAQSARCDEWIATAGELTRERDEARAELTRLRSKP
jgi:hypothetical protein